jgi:hypothetical protein
MIAKQSINDVTKMHGKNKHFLTAERRLAE